MLVLLAAKKHLKNLFVVCFSAMAFACTDPTHGLYQTVEKEVSITQIDSGLPKTFNPTMFASYNGVYVVTGSVLYGTTMSGDWSSSENNHITLNSWTKIALPAENISTFSTAVLGTDFFALTIGNNSSSSVSIYRTSFDSTGSNGRPSYTSLSSGDWTSCTETVAGLALDLDTYRPCQLFSVNGELILMTRTEISNGATYTLFTYDTASQGWDQTELAQLNSQTDNYSPWVGIIHTGANDTWWFLKSNGNLHTLAGSLSNTPISITIQFASMPADPLFRNAYADDSDLDGVADTAYFLSGKGFVSRTTDGVTWDNSKQLGLNTTSTVIKPLGFSTACRIVMKDINGQSQLSYMLFGSSGDDARYFSDGLYYISGAASLSTMAELSAENGNYTSTQLQDNGINHVFFDMSAANRSETPVFVCSSTNGLWSALLNSVEKTNPSLMWSWE